MTGLGLLGGVIAIGGAIFAAVRLRCEFESGEGWIHVKAVGLRSYSRSEDPELFWMATVLNWFLAFVLLGFGIAMIVIP